MQHKIVAQSSVIQQRIKDIVDEWATKKPVQGSLKPSDALETIRMFESNVAKLKGDYEMLKKAKETLDLEHKSDESVAFLGAFHLLLHVPTVPPTRKLAIQRRKSMISRMSGTN